MLSSHALKEALVHWNECPAVIIDTGSSSCTYGFSSGGSLAKPKTTISSICALSHRKQSIVKLQSPVAEAIISSSHQVMEEEKKGDRMRRRRKEGECFGESALKQVEMERFRPVEGGVINDWEAMEVLTTIFDDI